MNALARKTLQLAHVLHALRPGRGCGTRLRSPLVGYRRHGALVQELVPPQGYDLRVLVAGGRVVGVAFRVAAPGEWRTNVALGGVRRSVAEPPREAAALALDAARVGGAALVGVDLLLDGRAAGSSQS